jgi:hypothetical protein
VIRCCPVRRVWHTAIVLIAVVGHD